MAKIHEKRNQSVHLRQMRGDYSGRNIAEVKLLLANRRNMRRTQLCHQKQRGSLHWLQKPQPHGDYVSELLGQVELLI